MSTLVVNLPKHSISSTSGDATAANQVITNTKLDDIYTRLSPTLLSGVVFNDVQASYPDTVTELYKYYNVATLMVTIEVTYEDETKEKLIRARKI